MVFKLNVLGDFLNVSGCVSMITSANVTAEGRAFGLQKGLHTSRGQWAHQVTATALVVLLCRSYDAYEITTDEDELDSDAWCKHTAPNHPQFHYWHQVMQLELLLMLCLEQPLFSALIRRNAEPPLSGLSMIIPYMCSCLALCRCLSDVIQVDIVWDVYKRDSL